MVKHILNTKQFTKDEVEQIFSMVPKMEKICSGSVKEKPLEGKIIATIFFEPSTRTRLSFETAALRLGAQVISSENASANSSAKKGETAEDTARILSCFADAIVVRHSEVGSVEKMASAATKSMINAGDGTNQHPTQGLLDLYTIKKELGKLEGLSIAFVGDVLNSRTVRSLLPLLALYGDNTIYLFPVGGQTLTEEYKNYLREHKVKFEEAESLLEILPKLDVLYMTRLQKERFTNPEDYEKEKNYFILKPEHVQKMKKDSIIMHPLPRVEEIDPAVDSDPRAAYFRQVQNGLLVRMALLLYVFGI
ncbi:MAG: aspartate carbamoyltransferase [Patescibacteria group bacterium]